MLKPILFNTEMVRAILDGRKTVTRRILKPKYRDDEAGFQVITTMSGEFVRVEKLSEWGSAIFPDGTERHVHPPYQPGDILYVRETWGKTADLPGISEEETVYAADFSDRELAHLKDKHFRWRPSIHMPRELARLYLKATDVRAERLNNLNTEELIREGIKPEALKAHGCECAWKHDGCRDEPCANRDVYEYFTYAYPFSELWDSTIPKVDLDRYGWDANPWVWRIGFEVCEKPEV